MSADISSITAPDHGLTDEDERRVERVDNREAKIVELEDQLRRLAPEATSGDKEALAKAKRIAVQIEEIRRQGQLADLAGQENDRRKRETEAKKRLAAREQARQDFVRNLGRLLKLDGIIAHELDELQVALIEYTETARALSHFASLAQPAPLQADRAQMINKVERFVLSKLADVLPLNAERQVASPQIEHKEWMKQVKATLKEPLQPTKRDVVEPPPAAPRSVLILDHVFTTDEQGQKATASVLVGKDGVPRTVVSPSMGATNEARSYYPGGHLNEVKPEDVAPLLDHGYTLKRTKLHPNGLREVTEILRKEPASAKA